MSEEPAVELLNRKSEAEHVAQVDRIGAKLQARFRKLQQAERSLGVSFPVYETAKAGTQIHSETTSRGGVAPLTYEGGSTLVHDVDSFDPQNGYSGKMDRLNREPKYDHFANKAKHQTTVSREIYGAGNGLSPSEVDNTAIASNVENGTLTGATEHRNGDHSEVTELTPAESAQAAAAIYGNMRNGLVEREKVVEAEVEARQKAA